MRCRKNAHEGVILKWCLHVRFDVFRTGIALRAEHHLIYRFRTHVDIARRVILNFRTNKLSSSTREVEWLWNQYIQERFELSHIEINGSETDFNRPSDYFELTDGFADKISLIGRKYSFFSQPISLLEFELRIWGSINAETQIGVLLGSIKHLRPTADVYGLFAKYKYIDKSVYCAITICFVDKDTGEEMETAVFEISEDEDAYVLPVAISGEALDYYSFDDLAKLAYWLGNFWVGVQFELNNRPEEIRIIDQRGPITPRFEKDLRNERRIVLIKRVIPIDEEGNEIEYSAIHSGRQYSDPVWGVRGHPRRLSDGRIIYVRPYLKGKERNNPEMLNEKEYKFIEEKIESDIEN